MTPDALKHAIKQIKMDETMQARVLRRSLDFAKEHEMCIRDRKRAGNELQSLPLQP